MKNLIISIPLGILIIFGRKHEIPFAREKPVFRSTVEPVTFEGILVNIGEKF